MQKLTHKRLIEILSETKGMVIIGLQALIDARAKKTGNPFGEISKQIRATGFVGADYEKAVNREAERQGAKPIFKTEKLPFGQWVQDLENKIIEYKGEYYLRTQSTPGTRRYSPARVLCYRDSEGKFLSPKDIKDFLPLPTESRKQSRIGLGSKTGKTDDFPLQVWVRTYKLKNIQKIRIKGRTYELIP